MVIDKRSEKRDIKTKQKNVLCQIVLYAENVNWSDMIVELLLLCHDLHSSYLKEYALRNTIDNKLDFTFSISTILKR